MPVAAAHTTVELVAEHVTLAGVDSRTIRTDGSADRPAFLLLHGFSDSADGWRRLQRRLGAAGYRTVAVDQPAHGVAGAIDPDRPAAEQFVEFAAAAARHVDGGRPVIVVGNSLGGAHALLLAQHHPELVLGVVAISPASFDHPDWFGVLDRLDGGRFARAGADRPRFVPPPALRRLMAGPAMRAVAFGRPWRAPSGFLDQWRRHWRDPERRSALIELVPRVNEEYIKVDPIDLDAIRRPVLALWGTNDRLVRISSRRRLERGLADLEFVPLPGVGHMPQLETPGRTTKHVVAFAERLAAASDPPPDD